MKTGDRSGDRLPGLLESARRIVSVLDPDEVLQTVLDAAVRALGVDRGAILLRDAETGGFDVRAARGLEPAEIEEAASLGRSVVEQVLAQGGAVIRPRVTEETLVRRRVDRPERGRGTVLCAPLVAWGTVIGAIYLDAEAPAEEDAVAEPLLAAFANLAAVAIENARAHHRLQKEHARLTDAAMRPTEFGRMLGASPAMKALFEKLRALARSPIPVLIEGETGTGKEVAARAIHEASDRRGRPFVPVHCGAIPETLIESELFGHKRGAFTGADRDRAGLIEEAHGGTLFLDEVSTAPPAVQVRLLRVLQEGEVLRVGENAPRRVNLRLLCATNQNLEEMVRAGRFREDLFFRIHVAKVRIPPLRERREDVVVLAQRFLKQYAEKFGRSVEGFAPDAVEAMRRHAWPGNVRELENVVQRAVAMSDGPLVEARHLELPTASAPPAGEVETLREARERIDRELIVRALRASGGEITAAAKSLGVLRQQLSRLLVRYRIDPRKVR